HDPAPPARYSLSLPAALPIYAEVMVPHGDGLGPVADLLAELGEHAPQTGTGELGGGIERGAQVFPRQEAADRPPEERAAAQLIGDRKSTRLNSSHRTISYAGF